MGLTYNILRPYKHLCKLPNRSIKTEPLLRLTIKWEKVILDKKP